MIKSGVFLIYCILDNNRVKCLFPCLYVLPPSERILVCLKDSKLCSVIFLPFKKFLIRQSGKSQEQSIEHVIGLFILLDLVLFVSLINFDFLFLNSNRSGFWRTYFLIYPFVFQVLHYDILQDASLVLIIGPNDYGTYHNLLGKSTLSRIYLQTRSGYSSLSTEILQFIPSQRRPWRMNQIRPCHEQNCDIGGVERS